MMIIVRHWQADDCNNNYFDDFDRNHDNDYCCYDYHNQDDYNIAAAKPL